MPACRIVVLVSGAGTNLQALLDACSDAAYGAQVVAVGADRDGIEGLERAERAGIPTFHRKVTDFESRAHWDVVLSETVAAFEPDLVVLAGFMKLVGPEFLDRFLGRVADALAYGVKVTGATLFVVDEGVDTGPIIAQSAVPVLDDDDAHSLHERIKVAERSMLVESVGRLAREGFTITDRKVRIG